MAHLAHMQEIRLESLADGPGLLPYKLGRTRLITHYHSFLQYIELDNIENKALDVKNQLLHFQTKLDNDTVAIYSLQINYLLQKIGKVENHLKGLEPNRVKRGLIDGLGSIIKSITGNLDHQDAIRFNDAINNLQNNDNKIISEFNSHISLSKEWMTQHSYVIDQLVKNQQSINATLELLLDSDAHKETSLLKYAQFAQLLTIITENVDDILRELNRIENILALVRALSTHHSMVDIDTLSKMVDRLRIIYGDNRVLSLDLRDYYSIIKPGSYYSGKEIVIVFRIPIVSSDLFDLYKLSVAPNRFNQVLIPPHPFLATNEKAYAFMEAECPKINEQFLCVENIINRIKNQHDCVRDLITDHVLGETCNLTTVTLNKEAMEQLDDKDYTVAFPRSTKVHLQCGREEFKTLQGSYLITLPRNCTMTTPEFTITNENNVISGQPLLITDVTYNFNKKPTNLHRISLQTIDLRELHEAQKQIMLQPAVKAEPLITDAFYHTTLPFYSILFSASTLALIVFFRKHNPWKCEQSEHSNQPSLTPVYEDLEKTGKPSNFPATFSVKVGK